MITIAGLGNLILLPALYLHHLPTASPSSNHNTQKPHLIKNLQTINMRSKFKDEHPFEKRKAEAERIRQKYADRIPVSHSSAPALRAVQLAIY